MTMMTKKRNIVVLIASLILCLYINNNNQINSINTQKKNVRVRVDGGNDNNSNNSNSNSYMMISQIGLDNIANHKYVSGQYTYIDDFLSPKYLWIAENLLPYSLTPNSVTLLGGFFMLIAYCITMLYQSSSNNMNMMNNNIESTKTTTTTTKITCLLCAICIVLYTLFDALDGKQARRTGLSSPFGQILDHGVDALVVIIHCSIFGYYTCLLLGRQSSQCPPYYQILQSTLQFGCFIASWEEYHTHIFSTSTNKYFGVTEVNLSLTTLALINGFLIKNHNEFWGQKLRNIRTKFSLSSLSSSGSTTNTTTNTTNVDSSSNNNNKKQQTILLDTILDMELRCATVVLIAIFFSIQMIMSFYRVYSYYYHDNNDVDENHYHNNVEFIRALIQLVSPFLLAISPIVLLPKQIIQLNTRIVSLGIGFGLSLMAIKMNIFSLTKTPYNNVEQFVYFALPAIVSCSLIRIIIVVLNNTNTNTSSSSSLPSKDKDDNTSSTISNNEGQQQQQQQQQQQVILSLSRMLLIGLCIWQIVQFLSWTLPVSIQIHQHFSK